MQIQKTIFFTNDEISSDNIITLKPKSFDFDLYTAHFHYSSSKNRFSGLNCKHDNQSLPLITQFLDNLNVQYTTYTIQKITRRLFNGDTRIKFDCDNPCDFISKLKKVSNEEIIPYVKVVYESEEYLNKTPYTRDFFARNIKTMLDYPVYCTICLKFKNDNEDIDISLSGHSIIISGSIQEQCHLTNVIQNITSDNTFRRMTNTKSFIVSNEDENGIDLNQVNDLFNCTLDYFPDLKIEYIYIGFNDYSL